MDHIIYFKQQHDLKSKLDSLRLSYKRPYQISFVQSLLGLTNLLRKNDSCLLFFFCDSLTKENTLILRNLSFSFEELRICLCSNSTFALDAWKLNMFHFLDHPVKSTHIKSTYNKYLTKTGNDQTTLNIKSDEGLISIPYKMINYFEASGNYTSIHLKNGKKVFQTKQLRQFEYCCEEHTGMYRIHRSYIMNMNNVLKVGGGSIRFKGNDNILEVSQALEKKVKKHILAK